jgi:hypothetical protein
MLSSACHVASSGKILPGGKFLAGKTVAPGFRRDDEN